MNKSNIVLIHRTGGDFTMSDVYLLASHINKYWEDNVKPTIYCYSDSVTVEIVVVGLIIRPLPNKTWKGWWSKMNLFAPELEHLRPFLYLDLDTVVLKSLSTLIPPENSRGNFIALRDFKKLVNMASGVMWLPNTIAIDFVYSNWNKNVNDNIKGFRGDQNFIESVIKPDIYWQDICQPEYVTTFKPKSMWRTEFPVNSAVVCFHGKPRINEAANTIKWVQAYVNYEI